GSAQNLNSWLHEVTWHMVAPFPAAGEQDKKRWLIIDGHVGLGPTLAGELRQHGHEILGIFYEDDVTAKIAALSIFPDSIVYFPAGAKSPALSSAEQELWQVQAALATVGRLVSALLDGAAVRQGKLWIVTQGAWHIPEAGHGSTGHPHMTALWGVGR